MDYDLPPNSLELSGQGPHLAISICRASQVRSSEWLGCIAVQSRDMVDTLISQHRLHSRRMIRPSPRHWHLRHNIADLIVAQIVTPNLIETEE